VTNAVPLGNQILDTLPELAKGALRPFLRRIFLQRRADATDQRLSESLLFPVDSLVRASLAGENGRPIPVMAMGRRSAVGMSVWLGDRSITELRVLEPGNAWMLPVSLRDKPFFDAILARSLSAWVYRTLMVTAYRLMCNVEHNVDRRLAHALLWIADETGRPQVSLTHQALSELTAMRRPSVSLVLSDLQRRGIVRTVHGSIGILDRRRLERESCPCYLSTRAIMHATHRP
jgi:CRP-like cAMP-binding protein